MTLKAGSKCILIHLKQRPDLNGNIVTISKWNKKHERWEVCGVDGNGATFHIRVRPENLREGDGECTNTKQKKEVLSCSYRLDPTFAHTLKNMVCGGGHLKGVLPSVGSGQISNLIFTHLASLAVETYTNVTDETVLAMFLEHIGKEGDSRLIQKDLKGKLDDFLKDVLMYVRMPVPPFSNMISTADLGKLMFNLREGTLAYIESRRAMLTNHASELKGYKLVSDRHEANVAFKRMCSFGSDNKSVKITNLAQDLRDAAIGGEVTIIGGTKGIKHVTVNEVLHDVYIRWAFEDVLQTMSASDVRSGPLCKWHRLESWEKQLTRSIQVTESCIILDVSDEFEPYPWMQGLLSFNLKVLSDAPGVDTDRRILRMTFFAELAWQILLKSGILDKKRGIVNTSSSSITIDDRPPSHSSSSLAKQHTGSDDNKREILEIGSKVIITDMSEKYSDLALTNGMQGRIIERIEPDHFSVSFTNLSEPQIVHVSYLKKETKVQRESHVCICGKSGHLLCSRCGMVWYCSVKCQKQDYSRHSQFCKIMASEDGFVSLFRSKFSKISVDEDSSDEETC